MINARPWMHVLIVLLAGAAPVGAQVRSMQPNSARNCAVCHLAWVESFRRPDAVLLMDRPPESSVSDEHNCLGCHDGSVGDSRHRVWLEHGHRTGIKPPASMNVPDRLPLDDGKINCRTCHTAHSGGPETLATTVFQRMPNESGQLCLSCHTAYTPGPKHGSHPLGPMKVTLPESLARAGARAGRDGSHLTCQSCHTPHGGREDALLVFSANSNQLCVSCHERVDPAVWGADAAHQHPQSPTLKTDAQKQFIKDAGTVTGPNDTLICMSCHKMHHAPDNQHMLVSPLDGSQICLKCHPGFERLAGGSHDLRKSAPNERNRLDLTPEAGGPCSACHSFHRFARLPQPAPGDPTGRCTTCHRQDGCAPKATGMPLGHPTHVPSDMVERIKDLLLYPGGSGAAKDSLACLTCHDPHETGHAHFMRKEPEALCLTCHAENNLAGMHDFTRLPELKNVRGKNAVEVGKCGFCHAVHGESGPALWVGAPGPLQSPDDWCLTCHRQDHPVVREPMRELRHPTGPATRGRLTTAPAFAPLFDERGHRVKDGFVTCASCHNPHNHGNHFPASLRGDGTLLHAGICVDCHADMGSVAAGLHSPLAMREHFQEITLCMPCHSAHAKPGTNLPGTWAGPVGQFGEAMGAARCTGCHSPEQIAPLPALTYHPPVGQPAPATTDQGRPYHDDLKPDAQGRIVCATCHLPHGRIMDAAPAVATQPADLEQSRAARTLLRPYRAPNLCSSCHGFEGLMRFLYFHEPGKFKTAGE